MSDGTRKPTPAPRRRQIDGQDPAAIEDEYVIQPGRQNARKRWIVTLLADDSPFDLCHGHNTEVQVRSPLSR